MYKKSIALFAAGILCITAFSSCKAPEGEPATVQSDSDSVTVQYKITEAEEKISLAEEANPAISIEKFNTLLENPDLHAVAYEGTEDFIFSKENHIDKTIIINTYGKAEINSSVTEVIVLGAQGGITVNAAADSLMIKGDSVNTGINSDVNTIYVIGKDAKLHIYEGNVSNIFARNTTTMIYNHTRNDITVTLTNGTTVTIPGKHTYSVNDNTLTKGIID